MKADPKLMHPKPVISDTKSLYSIKKGADFISGFVYGTGWATLDDDKLFQCISKEKGAEPVFVKASTDLATAIKDRNGNLAVKAFGHMIDYIIDLAKELKHDFEKTG